MINEMICVGRRTQKKIPDVNWTHDLPYTSWMLSPLSYWELSREQVNYDEIIYYKLR